MEQLKKTIYVWQAPVRVYHWLNAGAIIVLFVTGLYIGRPVMKPYGEATGNFVMGNISLIHAITAYIFSANLIFRAYWALVGNEYAHFRPWQKGFWPDAYETVKYYMFLKTEHTVHVGHNVIAQLMYFFVMWLGSAIMIVTGFAMRSAIKPGSWVNVLFGWLCVLIGPAQVRTLHHLSAWAFGAFIVGHLYMVIRQDILDEDGTVSSIISGYKFGLVKPDHNTKED